MRTTEARLHRSIVLNSLEEISSEIFNLDIPRHEQSNIGGIWGEFTLTRSLIKGGVRFALKECPNALCWTVTTGLPPSPESIVVHLTINRQHIKSQFMEEIEGFLADHCLHLKEFLSIERN